MHPDWLGSPQHFIGSLALAAALVLLAPRAGIRSPWVAAALAVGLTMVAESIVEIAEYPLLYTDDPNLTAYYDTVADITASLVGALVGAGIGLALWRPLGLDRS